MSDLQHRYARPLNDIALTKSFIEQVLQCEHNKTLLQNIVTGEASLLNYDSTSPTLDSDKHRVAYTADMDRWKLRKRIVDELFTKPRVNDDDTIRLGKGGALPNTGVRKESKAIIVTGLPASGKSGVSDLFADQYGAIILDSDYAKRKLPEYKNNPAGATLVHDESDIIIMGGKVNGKPDHFKSLFELCYHDGINIVIPKIGHNVQSLIALAESIKDLGYKEIHLVLVSLDRRIATTRALLRFKKSKRYVPLSLIFDGYGNEPILTYYRIKEKNIKSNLFESVGKLSNDVEPMQPLSFIDSTHDSSPACLYKQK
jgi:dephospho-CoA kinase